MTQPQKTRPVRECTACEAPLSLEEIVYSSNYPDQVPTRNGFRKGTLKDAPRVWCSADCAKESYRAPQVPSLQAQKV